MHHLVFGINFTSISPTSQLIIPTLVIDHSFSLSLQAQNQHFPTVDFFYLLDCLTIGLTGLNRTYYAHDFIFSFAF